MQIDPNNLKWYAAFHNEGHHPHIHMIVYAADAHQGYLNKKGIYDVRKHYANTIFKQDLYHVFEEQTKIRNEIKRGLVKNLTSELVVTRLISLQNVMRISYKRYRIYIMPLKITKEN